MADELVNRLMQPDDYDPVAEAVRIARQPSHYRNPAVENFRADPYNELGTQVSTQDVNGRLPQTNALSGLVRALAGHVPENSEHAFSLVNMLSGGLRSLGNWTNGSVTASDMLAPPGMGFLRGAGSSAARNAAPASLYDSIDRHIADMRADDLARATYRNTSAGRNAVMPQSTEGLQLTRIPVVPSPATLGRPGAFSYMIHKDGKPFGDVHGYVDGNVAHVLEMGADTGPGALGVSGIRQLREAMREDFPHVTGFAGVRTSGSRNGPASAGGGLSQFVPFD